jgi:hypothetical protein
MAHTARVLFKADGHRMRLRSAHACSALSFRAPAGARSVQIKATVRNARELRSLRLH